MLLNEIFDLKSASAMPHTIIRMKQLDPEAFQKTFKDTAAKAPKLFHQACMVLDLSKTPQALSKDKLVQIKHAIETTGARLIAVAHPTESQKSTIESLNLPILTELKAKKKEPTTQQSREVMLTNKVRRSMQIYAKDKDLIVKGDVNQGAEVVADGSIFVFGNLHGKAIAGASGDTADQIITLNFNPELVAISGVYVLHENIPNKNLGGRIRVSYYESKIQFTDIGEVVKTGHF